MKSDNDALSLPDPPPHFAPRPELAASATGVGGATLELGYGDVARLDERADSGRARTAENFPGLRIVRTLAMLSVIAHHIAWEPVLGVAFGVTSLQLVMCALQTRRTQARPFGEVARSRFLRLIVPWVLWSVIYAGFEFFRSPSPGGAPAGGATSAESSVLGLLHGGSFHLWFLPFAFFACLLANRMHRASQEQARELAIPLFSLLGTALVLLAPTVHRELGHLHSLSYWIDGAGTIAFGVAMGRTLSIPNPDKRGPWFLLILFCGSLPMMLGPQLVQVTPLYDRYAFAICLSCSGFLLRHGDGRLLALLSAYNMGVYLVHMLVLRGMHRFPALDELALLPQLALCYLLCLLAVHLIRKLRIPYLA